MFISLNTSLPHNQLINLELVYPNPWLCLTLVPYCCDLWAIGFNTYWRSNSLALVFIIIIWPLSIDCVIVICIMCNEYTWELDIQWFTSVVNMFLLQKPRVKHDGLYRRIGWLWAWHKGIVSKFSFFKSASNLKFCKDDVIRIQSMISKINFRPKYLENMLHQKHTILLHVLLLSCHLTFSSFFYASIYNRCSLSSLNPHKSSHSISSYLLAK